MKMCAKCGGSMKKGGATKKMAKGGVQKIVGMPGYNATLYPTSFKKGGVKKMQSGGEKPDKSVLKNILGLIGGGSGILAGTILGNREKDSEKANERDNKRIQRKSDRREKKGYKPISRPSFKNGGSTSFGMLSVKAGVDKNPKPTAADRIAGAKMKKKMGGSAKPSADLSAKTKSNIAKKASAGKDIGKKGKGFAKVAAAAGGGEKGKRIAAAAMWKNIKRG
jgi:hypothetical protein